MKTHLIIAIFVGSLFHIIYYLDFFKTVQRVEIYTGCEYLNTEIPGAEDIVKYKQHLIFASGNLGQLFGKGVPKLEQAQFYIVLNAEKQSIPQQMKMIGFPSNVAFYAHGLHVWQNNNKYYLFAVNHAYKFGGERIEVFQIMDDKIIEYRNSIIMDSQYIGTLKDLIVINDERFLITKLMPYTDPIEGRSQWDIGMTLKNLAVITLKYQRTSIIDCQFNLSHVSVIPNCHTLNHQFTWTGGITWDNNSTIWVGDNLRKTIYQFKITELGLKKENTINLPHQIDNINYEDSKLIIAMNPKAYQNIKLNLYLKSNVLKKQTDYQTWSSVGEYDLQTNQLKILYQSDAYIRGLSQSIIMNGKMYLASWADYAPMVCYKVE